MDNFFIRYRNETVLIAILFIQVIALATQVRVPAANVPANAGTYGGTRLIRVWAVNIVAPLQKLFVYTGAGFRNFFHNYIDLRDVRQQNQELQKQLDQMRLEQARLQQDVAQARRLQDLLQFKEQFIARTLAAQVIGTSGTDLSRVIYIDRGTNDGIATGMAVISPYGIVGKVSRADRRTSQVLLISDPSSGAGVLLERQHLNGILKGTPSGTPEIQNVMSDEKIEVGDSIITTGGDRVFPKGLKVGTVASVAPDMERDPFLSIKVKPAADLNRLEEVLVITELGERTPSATEENKPMTASEMLAQRLPSAKKKEADTKAAPGRTPATTGQAPAGSSSPTAPKPKPAARPAVPPPSTETPR